MTTYRSEVHPSIDATRVADAIHGDLLGICIACGEDAYGVEPDARRYECDVCGERKVYGASEIWFRMGYGV